MAVPDTSHLFGGVAEQEKVNRNTETVLQFTQNTKRESMRTDWGNFPNAVIAHTASSITSHANYLKAKAGDIDSALALVDNIISDNYLKQIHDIVKGIDDVYVLPVHAEEQLGRNKIPMAFALTIGKNLNLNVETNIVQANKVNRSGADGVARLLKRVNFNGKVTKGRNYLIVDDVITQGGTLADLRAYVEQNSGNVVLVSALNGKENSAKLPITKVTLGQLRKQAGKDLEQWWWEQFNYDFSKLTESEARYLTKQIHRNGIDAVRDSLFETRP